MKILVLLLVTAAASAANAKLPKSDWTLNQGKLTYNVSYPVKDVSADSTSVKGKGRCAGGTCQFLVAVPVKSFMSGDGNRDNHMLEVTKGALHPMVTVRVTFAENFSDHKADAKVDINFAGKSHTYEHLPITIKISDKQVSTTGRVPLVLSDFAIERPSLLAVKVQDAAPVDFELSWN